MPITLQNLVSHPNADAVNVMSAETLGPVASVVASTANSTVTAALNFPFQYKIRYVSIAVGAITAVSGTGSWNLVVGGLPASTGNTYTQGNIAGNDNSLLQTTPGVGGFGYPTNVAVVGNCVFANDVPFNSANTVAANTLTPQSILASGGPSGNLIGQAVPNTGWYTLTTSGGYGLFVPTNYDAVYPVGIPLTLRVTTPASFTIANLTVTVGFVPIKYRSEPMSVAGQVIILPATDY